MSWYNDDLNNGFIDTTQDFVGGGGSSTSITNIQDDLTDLKEVFKPKVLDNVNESLDTIIVNNTPNSRIFLQNANTTPKIRIEGGKLYLYYDYSFTNAPTISAGWTDVVNYITALKQEIILEAANIVTLDTTIFTPTVGLLPRVGQVEILATTTAGEVIQLKVEVEYLLQAAARNTIDDGLELSEELADNLTEAIRNYRNDSLDAADNLSQLVQNSAYSAMGAETESAAGVAAALFNSKAALYTAYFAFVVNTIVGSGVIIAVVGFIYDLITSSSKEKDINKLLVLYERIKNESSANSLLHIHLDGLLIIENTNNGFLSINDYIITLSNGGKIKIEIKLINTEKKAFIKEVIKEGSVSFNVGDIINIPKTSLGGTTGNLQIQVTSLISEVTVLANLINKTTGDMIIIQNRRRLREGVINKNEFGDGLTIAYNSSITNAETGEVLQVPTIKLNLNSAQLETINGVLNIKKYVNQDNIDIINGNISVQDAEIADINASLERVYKVILPTGQTITSDYKLNLGYKEIFSGFPYDLIMLAIKKDTYTTFSSANYNYDYLGYFPNMNRLSQLGDIKVISDSTLTVNASQHFTKGFIYMKNTNELKTFNLNRKFEFVSFLKFVSFNNNITDYHLIQTAVDLGQGFIEIDYTKFSLYIRNRRFKIKHPAVVEYQIYTVGNNNAITAQLITPNTYVILEPYTIGGTIYNDNIRIGEQYIAGNPNDFQYDLRMINVPYKINNNTPHINTPTALIKTVNSNDTSTPTNEIVFFQQFNIPSV